MTARPIVLPSVAELALVKLPCHREENGTLVVVEGGEHVPFSIARMFVVSAQLGAVRGQHAHRSCAQFFTCASGGVEVLCDDGVATVSFRLDRPDLGLHVPAGIWAQQTYLASGSTLTVLCDRPYEPADYIRHYAEFRSFRAAGQSDA